MALASCGARTSIEDVSSDAKGTGSSSHDASAEGASRDAGAANDSSAGARDIGADVDPDTLPTPGPFCAVALSLISLSVWSNTSGVFVLQDEEFSSSSFHPQIFFNGGAGWSLVTESTEPQGPRKLSGFGGEALLEYGRVDCGVILVENGIRSCSAAVSGVDAVSVVNDHLAYAIEPPNILLVYDGTQWKQVGSPLSSGAAFMHALWAASDTVLAVGDETQVFVYSGSAPPQPQAGVPPGNYLAAWGFGADDLWIGNDAGELVHYDGTDWRPEWASEGSCGAILGMWGDADSLYFYTRNAVLRWQNGQVQSLFSLPCAGTAEVSSLWGTSTTQVFVTVQDSSAADASCGGARILSFDGAEFVPL